MRHAEGVLRAILLAIIVTFGVTTPVQADLPEEECTEENSGEVASRRSRPRGFRGMRRAPGRLLPPNPVWDRCCGEDGCPRHTGRLARSSTLQDRFRRW
jgi:hypothetical protein